jgi:hypothetical protein
MCVKIKFEISDSNFQKSWSYEELINFEDVEK